MERIDVIKKTENGQKVTVYPVTSPSAVRFPDGTTMQVKIDAKADKIQETSLTPGASSYTISPNKSVNLGTLASNVTFSLATSEEVSGMANIYSFVFSCGSSAPTITWPSGLSWVGGSEPSVNSDKAYEVSISNGKAVIAEF